MGIKRELLEIPQFEIKQIGKIKRQRFSKHSDVGGEPCLSWDIKRKLKAHEKRLLKGRN